MAGLPFHATTCRGLTLEGLHGLSKPWSPQSGPKVLLLPNWYSHPRAVASPPLASRSRRPPSARALLPLNRYPCRKGLRSRRLTEGATGVRLAVKAQRSPLKPQESPLGLLPQCLRSSPRRQESWWLPRWMMGGPDLV